MGLWRYPRFAADYAGNSWGFFYSLFTYQHPYSAGWLFFKYSIHASMVPSILSYTACIRKL